MSDTADSLTSARDVRRILTCYRLPLSTEAALQEAVREILAAEMSGAEWQREIRFNAEDRIDLWSDVLGVGIECKIDGNLPSVIRQLQRYAAEPRVNALVLVTTRWKLLLEADEIGGKPFESVYVGGSL